MDVTAEKVGHKYGYHCFLISYMHVLNGGPWVPQWKPQVVVMMSIVRTFTVPSSERHPGGHGAIYKVLWEGWPEELATWEEG